MKKIVNNLILMVGASAHFMLSGAALFGDIVIAPVVLSAPPASLEIFQGSYAYDSTPFWRPANIIALGLVIVAMILNWRTPRKKLVITWFVGFVVITILSIGFVFPEYVEITTTPFSETIDTKLIERGSNWRIISWIRGALFFIIGFLPLVALTHPLQSQHKG